MKNYVYIYYNNGTRDDVSIDESKAAYGAWFGGLADKLVDAGNPFNSGAKEVKRSGVTPVETLLATGYSIVKADSLEEAVKLTENCPILDEPEGSVRVYEALAM